jgi:hypothetical protein
MDRIDSSVCTPFTSRSGTWAAAALVMLTATLVPAHEAAAAAVLPDYAAARLTPITPLQSIRGAVLVGSHLYIAGDNEVDVINLDGTEVAAVTGIFGASGLSVSANKSTVYAAASTASGIVAIDTATQASTSIATAHACPTATAITGTTLLYTYGCSTVLAPSGIAGVDLADVNHPASATDVTTDDSPVGIRAVGNRVVTWASGHPTTVIAYTAAGDGTLTFDASTTVGQALDLALYPDGTRLAATGYSVGYGLDQLTLPGLSAAGRFTFTSYPSAVAVSHDGSKVALGLRTSYEALTQIWDAGTGSVVCPGHGRSRPVRRSTSR